MLIKGSFAMVPCVCKKKKKKNHPGGNRLGRKKCTGPYPTPTSKLAKEDLWNNRYLKQQRFTNSRAELQTKVSLLEQTKRKEYYKLGVWRAFINLIKKTKTIIIIIIFQSEGSVHDLTARKRRNRPGLGSKVLSVGAPKGPAIVHTDIVLESNNDILV